MPRRIRSEDEKRQDRMAAYPTWFWSVTAELKAGKQIIEVACDRHNTAVNMRHRFHLFRKDLVFMKHPDSDAAVNTTLEVIDDRLIVHNIAHIGAELNRAIENQMCPIEGGQGEGGDQAIETVKVPDSSPDQMEELIRNTYFPKKDAAPIQPQPADNPPCTEHEPDTTGAFCLKCRNPL